MNVTVKLTLDGMIRALRWQAHALAEGDGGMYVDERRESEARRRIQALPNRREEDSDDRAGE